MKNKGNTLTLKELLAARKILKKASDWDKFVVIDGELYGAKKLTPQKKIKR